MPRYGKQAISISGNKLPYLERDCQIWQLFSGVCITLGVFMKSWLLSQLKTLLARKAEALLVLTMPAVVAVTEALQSYLVKLVPSPTEIWALRATEVAVIAILGAVLSFVYFRPKLKPLPWGVHQDVKTGVYFCSVCLIPNGIHSPMYLSPDGSVWRCHSNNTHRRKTLTMWLRRHLHQKTLGRMDGCHDDPQPGVAGALRDKACEAP